MAVSWKLEIGNVNLDGGRASVTATRTDDGSTLPPRVYTYQNVPLASEEDKTKLLESIKAEDAKQAQEAVDARSFIGNFDQTGKATLDAWEATR